MLCSPRSRQSAGEILAGWEGENRRSPLDRFVNAELRARRYLNSRERRWAAEAVFGSVRLWNRQQRLLELLSLPQTPESLANLWQWTWELEQKPDTESQTAVISYGDDFPNIDTVRKAWNQLPGRDDPAQYLRITLSFPDSIASTLEKMLGPEALDAAAALNETAPVTLRVNTLRATRNHLLESLEGSTPAVYSPWGVVLPGRVNLPELPGFTDGEFELQEEASQLSTLLSGARSGFKILEIGAGGGGKTLGMAAMMENRGEILAIDTETPRLNEIRRRASRAGVECVQPMHLRADSEGRWDRGGVEGERLSRWKDRADCVLIDAPCTGSGVLRRSPDARWRPFRLDYFTDLQRNLLIQGARYVAPGSVMIYITCALEPEQNEELVESFLQTPEGAEYEAVDPMPRLLAAIRRAQRIQRDDSELDESLYAGLLSGVYLRTWPHKHGLDGFFAACLRRKPV